MGFKIYPFLTLFFLLFVALSFAQQKGLKTINKNSLENHLKFIASDELLGRELGAKNNGLETTAEYIAEFAKNTGIKPGVDNYFQKLNLIAVTPDEDQFVEIKNRKGKTVYRSNDVINLNGANMLGNTESKEIVLAGFGTDEITDLDLKDKIVVIAQGDEKYFRQISNWN